MRFLIKFVGKFKGFVQDRYSNFPIQFRFTRETNNMKEYFPYETKRNIFSILVWFASLLAPVDELKLDRRAQIW